LFRAKKPALLPASCPVRMQRCLRDNQRHGGIFMGNATEHDPLKMIPTPRVVRAQLARAVREVEVLRRQLKVSEAAVQNLGEQKMEAARP
jgi:hypothetical protein